MAKKDDNPILQAFIFETETMIEQLEQILIECEDYDDFRESDVNEIFRIMHTVKGGSAMMEYTKLAELAHSMEDMFFYIREDKPTIEDLSIVTDIVLQGVDFMKEFIEALKECDDNTISELDADDIVDDIKICINSLKAGTNSAANTDNVKIEETVEELNAINATRTEEELNSINDINLEDDNEENEDTDVKYENYEVILYYQEGCEMENLRAFQAIQEYEGHCKAIEYYPMGLLDEETSVITEKIRAKGFQIHLKIDWPYNELQESVEKLSFIDKFTINIISDSEFGNFEKKEKKVEKSDAKSDSKKKGNRDKKKETESAGVKEQKRINVPVEKLDLLMELVGELVLSETMVVSNPDLKGIKLDNFAKAARQHRKIIGELQDIVMSIRMMPLSTTFSKMKRIVRDIGKKLDKEMHIELIGEETEVDKNIIEQIADPLMHLVRNAADHGLETSEERKQLGKTDPATITLEACNSGGDVIIKVIDNGRGLDKDKILMKAYKNGLIESEDTDLTEKQIFNMIFLPGFSTNEEVTEFSGRGVGMDVVRNNIEGLGGGISVDSVLNEGTTMTLKIPLTLAIVSGMIIRVGKCKYTIPIMSIRESFRPSNDDIIVDTEGNEMVMVRGGCYIIRRLNRMYDVNDAVEDFENGILIMIESNDDTFCIFADEIIGEQQVVVKPLPEYVKKFNTVHGIAGCTLLGDGDISLILDVASLNVTDR